MHGHDHAQVRVHVLELLGDETQADVVQARPAVLLGNADAEELQVGHPVQELPLEAVRAVEVVDLGGHLGRRPLADGSLDLLVLVGQIE